MVAEHLVRTLWPVFPHLGWMMMIKMSLGLTGETWKGWHSDSVRQTELQRSGVKKQNKGRSIRSEKLRLMLNMTMRRQLAMLHRSQQELYLLVRFLWKA